MRDFRYYRCSGTDGYRFGGERICSNTQIRADTLETEIWKHVRRIVKNPGSLEQAQDGQESTQHSVAEDVNALRAHRQKLRHGMERLIDSLAEGVIDKDQFTSRMKRTKTRIAELDTKIASQAADEDRHAHIRSAMSRLTELASHLQAPLKRADWATKREIIRAVVQRIEIGPTNLAIVLRLPTETIARSLEPMVVKLSRV